MLLWPDTFTNYLRPETGKAHVEVLEDAGFQVVLPERVLCCGRPLYDYGMLDTAERLLRTTIETLRPHIRAGTPLIGMEPSCVAVFRDELTELLPDGLDAERLQKQTLMLSEFLADRVPSWEPPQLDRKALVQRHCHHGAVMGFDPEEELLRKIGLDLSFPNPGCCGLAGSFGFEAGRNTPSPWRSASRRCCRRFGRNPVTPSWSPTASAAARRSSTARDVGRCTSPR